MTTALFLLFAACSSSPTPATVPTPAPPADVVVLPVQPPVSSPDDAPTCESFAEHLRQLFRENVQSAGDPSGRLTTEELLERVDEMANGVLVRCKQDDRIGELSDVTACIAAATSVTQTQACRGRFPEQGEALHAWMAPDEPK